MANVQKLLEIALAEKGYHEKASNTQLDDKTANSGSKNYTKYARDLFAAGYYNGNKNGYDWCDVFVDWCFWMACGKDAKTAQEMICQTGNLGAGVGYSARYYQNQGRFFESEPQPGDQIFFGSGDKWSHTGIVHYIENGKIYTIEGNVNQHVATCVYPLDYATIKGFGRPCYDACDEEEQAEETASAESDVDKLAQAIAGEITASGLNASTVLKRVQELLEAPEKAETPAPVVALEPGDKVKMEPGAPVWGQNYGFKDWVYESDLYVRDIEGDRIRVSTKKTGAITGSVHKKYLTKI